MSGNNWPSSAHHRPVLRASGNRACNERLADINQSIHLAKISNAKSTLNTFGPSHKPLVNLKKKQQQYEQQNAIAYANGNLAEHLLDIYQRPAPFRDERPRTARPPPPPFTLNGRVRQQEREKVLATNAFMIRQLCSASSHYADIFSTSPSSPAARSSSRGLSSTRTPSHQSSARASASRPVSASVRSIKSPSSSSSSRSSSSAQQRSASAKRPPLIFDEKIFADQLALPVLSPPDPSPLPSSSSSSSSSSTPLPADSAHIAVAKVSIWRCARPVVYEIRVAGTEIVTCRTRISLQDLQTFFPEAREREARVDCILSALQLVETPPDSSSSAVAHAPSSSLSSSSSSSSRSPVSVNAATSSSSSSAPRRRLMPVFRCGADLEPLMQGSGDRGGNDSGDVSSPSAAAAACVSPSSPAGGDPFADDNRDDNDDDDDEDYVDDCDDDNNNNNGSGGNDNNNAPGTAGDVVAQSAPSEYERPSTANGRVRVPASPDSDGFVDYDSAHFAFTDLDGDGGDGAGDGGDGDGDGASERVVESPPAQRRPSRPRVDIPPLELASVLTKS